MHTSQILKPSLLTLLIACAAPKAEDTAVSTESETETEDMNELDWTDVEDGDDTEDGEGVEESGEVDDGNNDGDNPDPEAPSSPEEDSDEPDAADGSSTGESSGVDDESGETDPEDEESGEPSAEVDDDGSETDEDAPEADEEWASGSVRVSGESLPSMLPPSGSLGTLETLSAMAPSGIITDVDFSISLEHSCTKDLTATLISPAGTRVVVFDLTTRPVCSSDMDDTLLSDEASVLIASGTSPFVGLHQPTGMLSDFDGENAAGQWILSITDDTMGDSGRLIGWSIDLRFD